MAKKFGKFLMVTAALGAVAAGVYYCLQGRDNFVDDDFDDDDDFDSFDDDLSDGENEKDVDRNYVDLDLENAEEFKEGLNAAKAEAADKVVGEVKEAADKVKETADKAEVKVEEFFDDDDSDGSMDAM
ncbi:MAG: hypothetical protein HDR28_04210 [Lachnospiraceae bacterium]|nr:hypothetical protein [Lachnospiraceae bacterium]